MKTNKCESCPAWDNIYGTYETPVYGCCLFDEDDYDEDEGCEHSDKQINNMLMKTKEQYQEYFKEEYRFFNEFLDKLEKETV